MLVENVIKLFVTPSMTLDTVFKKSEEHGIRSRFARTLAEEETRETLFWLICNYGASKKDPASRATDPSLADRGKNPPSPSCPILERIQACWKWDFGELDYARVWAQGARGRGACVRVRGRPAPCRLSSLPSSSPAAPSRPPQMSLRRARIVLSPNVRVDT